MVASTEAVNPPGEFTEPPLSPGPEAATWTPVGLPEIAMVGVRAVWPAVTFTLTDAGATVMLTGAVTKMLTLTTCAAQATGVQLNVNVPE